MNISECAGAGTLAQAQKKKLRDLRMSTGWPHHPTLSVQQIIGTDVSRSSQDSYSGVLSGPNNSEFHSAVCAPLRDSCVTKLKPMTGSTFRV